MIIGVSMVGRVGGINVLARLGQYIQELVVDLVCDERCWKFAEILFKSGGDRVDVEIGVGDVEVVAALEAFFDTLDQGIATGFAVNAFDVHS